jgi:hypothetical protein
MNQLLHRAAMFSVLLFALPSAPTYGSEMAVLGAQKVQVDVTLVQLTVAQLPTPGGFESVEPCSLEQYVAPSSESELRVLRDNLDQDVRMVFQAGEKELVLSLLCQASAAGIAAAEVRLGGMLAEGWGFFAKNEQQARYWLKRAANRGDKQAQYMLSVLYRMGRGGPVLGSEGMRLLRSAAESGNPGAQFELAAEYVTGDFVPTDLARARYWAELAARSGHREAQDFLVRLNSQQPR